MGKSIKGVEIFSVGKWNNQTFTERDLDKMVDSFNKVRQTVKPWIKIGHDDDQKLLQKEGLPSAGWVENMRRQGGKLVADFVDIPKKIYELIEKKAYRKVSIELFKNVEILESKFDFLITGVALLGAETPGVLNLKDILDRFKIQSYDATCTFTHESEQNLVTCFTDDGGTMGLEQDLADANAKVKLLEKQLADTQKEASKFKATNQEQLNKQKELEKTLKETKDQFSKTVAELEKQKLETQVAEMKTAGIITPAMEKGVFQLLAEKTEKFSITEGKEEKEVDKVGLVKHLFQLAKAGDANTDQQTGDGDGEGDRTDNADFFDKIDAEILKYQKEHECEYADAYAAIAPKYEDQLKAAE